MKLPAYISHPGKQKQSRKVIEGVVGSLEKLSGIWKKETARPLHTKETLRAIYRTRGGTGGCQTNDTCTPSDRATGTLWTVSRRGPETTQLNLIQ